MHYTCMCVNEKKSQQFLTHTVFVKHSNDYTYMIILSQCSSCSLHTYLMKTVAASKLQTHTVTLCKATA